MPWDANIVSTEFKGKLPLQSFNNLRGALVERCTASGTAIPAILNADLTKMNKLPDEWFSTFQSTITTLISAYVNHTDNAGDWTGQTTIPNWTEATILTAIGDALRLPVPSSIKAAAWCYQQYKILNLLRWVKKTPKTYYVDALNKAINEPWMQCQDTWNLNNWDNGIGQSMYNRVDWAILYNWWYQGLVGKKYKYIYNNPSLIYSSADFYIMPNFRLDGAPPDISQTIFPNNWTIGFYCKSYSVIEFIGDQTTAYFPETDISCNYTIKPNGYGGVVMENPNAILKFDGANGFGFKDW